MKQELLDTLTTYQCDKAFLQEQEEEIINDLIKLRDKYDISQKRLSELVDISQPSLARLEKKKISPCLSTMIKILAPLGYTIKVVPIDYEIQK